MPGIPDLVLPLSEGKVFWLEMKTKTGRLSDVQKIVHEKLQSLGHTVETAHSLKEAKEKLEAAIRE